MYNIGKRRRRSKREPVRVCLPVCSPVCLSRCLWFYVVQLLCCSVTINILWICLSVYLAVYLFVVCNRVLPSLSRAAVDIIDRKGCRILWSFDPQRHVGSSENSSLCSPRQAHRPIDRAACVPHLAVACLSPDCRRSRAPCLLPTNQGLSPITASSSSSYSLAWWSCLVGCQRLFRC